MDLIAILVLIYIGGPIAVIMIGWGAIKMWRKTGGAGLLVWGVALLALAAYFAYEISKVNFGL